MRRIGPLKTLNVGMEKRWVFWFETPGPQKGKGGFLVIKCPGRVLERNGVPGFTLLIMAMGWVDGLKNFLRGFGGKIKIFWGGKWSGGIWGKKFFLALIEQVFGEENPGPQNDFGEGDGFLENFKNQGFKGNGKNFF